MTIDPITIKKIREMYGEGIPKRQISQKLGIAPNSVNKYIRDNGYGEQYTDERQEIKKPSDFNKLEEEMQIMEMKMELQPELNETIDGWESIENPNNEDISLLYKVNYLSDKLEAANDIERVQWIRDKYYEIMQAVGEAMDAEAARVMEEEEKRKKRAQEKLEKKQKEYDRRYNWLKHNLVEVIKDVNAILPWPITERELEKIIIDLLPYGKPIFVLINPGKLTKILEKYVSKDDAEAMSRLWEVSI